MQFRHSAALAVLLVCCASWCFSAVWLDWNRRI